MKKFTITAILSLFLFHSTFGQDKDKYTELIKSAWSFYQSKDYGSSGEAYTEAFNSLGGKGTLSDRYDAACSWA